MSLAEKGNLNEVSQAYLEKFVSEDVVFQHIHSDEGCGWCVPVEENVYRYLIAIPGFPLSP